MKQNDIFRLALQAGFKEGDLSLFPSLLTKFANLIAAEVGIAQWHRGYAEGQAVEREACAQVAEWEPCMTHTPHRIAAAIRARSQQ